MKEGLDIENIETATCVLNTLRTRLNGEAGE